MSHQFPPEEPRPADRGCRAGQLPLRNKDWQPPLPERCRFYPGRDCPGWTVGGTCSRIGTVIPADDDDNSP